MSFFLAVDAGGTKTEYLLADGERELARVRTGTIKRMRADSATATRNLEAGLAELSACTGVSMQEVEVTCVGAAGWSVALVADWIRTAFAERVGGSLLLVGDVEIALDAAFQGAPGVVAIAGTGSNVAGRDQRGGVSTAGGWGPALSDQASGHRVGLQALRALFLAIDEHRSTALLDAILKRWDLGHRDALVEIVNRLPAPDFSELSPVVVACAERGDSVALEVIEQEAEEMAHLVRLMIARLQRQSTHRASDRDRDRSPGRDREPDQDCGREHDWLPEVAFTGSMLQHVPLLRSGIVSALRRDLPGLLAREGVIDPMLGALWRARSHAARD